jgi:cellulose synthase/poly-beta-1,6-N-acetylglucosamine synthase-like glycosyltransferase
MPLLEVIFAGASLALLLPTGVLLAEIVAASWSDRTEPPPMPAHRPRLAVIVPAHNEASLIFDTVKGLLSQMNSADRLIVVADNCTDETFEIAASAGVEVLTRRDLARRGKGYALNFAVQHLELDPPEVVVIVDADCRVAEGALERLAGTCLCEQRPVQALYLMHALPGAGVNVQIAEFAWTLKNWVRPLGLKRLRLPCQLMGTGMAFPWLSLKRANLATGHIVEDLKLGLDLARAGLPPLFCPSALVESFFPLSEEGLGSQRTRWEHGYLTVLLREAVPIILRALFGLNGPLLALGIDLCVPPIALLALLVALVWVGSGLLYALAGIAPPFLLTSLVAGLLAFSVFLCWANYGRQTLALPQLALAPGYALRKVPLYLKFLVARQSEWVRSKRDQDRLE